MAQTIVVFVIVVISILIGYALGTARHDDD